MIPGDTVTFPYPLGMQVKIVPLDNHTGTVEGYWYGRGSVLKISVRYFNSGESKDAYFFPDELMPVAKNNSSTS